MHTIGEHIRLASSYLDKDDAQAIAGGANGGFSIDASVRIEADHRAEPELERLLLDNDSGKCRNQPRSACGVKNREW